MTKPPAAIGSGSDDEPVFLGVGVGKAGLARVGFATVGLAAGFGASVSGTIESVVRARINE